MYRAGRGLTRPTLNIYLLQTCEIGTLRQARYHRLFQGHIAPLCRPLPKVARTAESPPIPLLWVRAVPIV